MAIKKSSLDALASSMPERDAELARRQDAARAIRLQQAVAQIPAQQAQQPQVAQQLGVQQAQVAGEQALQRQQATQQQAQQLTQAALQQQQQAASGEVAALELALKNQGIATEKELSDKQRALEEQIFQDQIAFQKDEFGRTEYNQEQLMDLALWSAKSKEDYNNKVQQIQQESQRELLLLETMYKKLEQAEKAGFAFEQGALDKESQVRIIEIKRALQERINKRKKDAAKRGIYGQAGGIVGGIAGGIIGGYATGGSPMGIAGGAAIGSAAGTAGGTAMSEQGY